MNAFDTAVRDLLVPYLIKLGKQAPKPTEASELIALVRELRAEIQELRAKHNAPNPQSDEADLEIVRTVLNVAGWEIVD